ncbi:ABC transporter A family member 1, partial [Diplonema papillatum]
MTQRDEVEMLTDLTTVNVEPPLEDDVHMQGFGIAGAIELVKYEQRHKTWSHLRLAIGKNVALKRRRPKVCIFEVLLPPIFVVLISVGYYAADLWDHPAADYMPQPYMNTTTSIRNSLCVHGLPEGYRNPNDFQLCSGCPYRIVDIASEPGTEWPGGVPPVLCGTLNVNGLIEFVRLFVNMTSPSDVPTLDTLIAVQKSYAELSGFFGSLGGVPSVVNALMRTGNLEFARGSGVTCAEAQSLIAGLRARSLLFDLVFQPNATNDPACPGVWADEYTAVRYIKGDGADTTWALVVLGQADAGNSQFDFTIRMNNSATPSTNSKQASFTQGLGAKPYLQYTTSGFVTLQTAISAVLSDVPTASFITCPMPTEAYKESEFFDQVSQLLPLYLTLAFIYPVNRLVAAIVLEKEDRQREGMLIMGLSRGSFYLSWYLTYAAVGTVSTIIIVVYTHNNLFSQSSPLLVFVLFEAFSLSIVAFSLLISVFFSKARIAAVAAPIFMMLTTLPRNIVDRDTVTPSGQHWLSLVSPSAFGYGIGLMCDYEGSGAGASFDDFTSGDYSFASSVFMMIVDTVLYLAVAWYLDNVLPSEWGVKKHPLFLCQPSYWRRSTERKVAANDQPPPAPNYEKFDPVTAAAMRERERVVITDMTKTFSGKKGPAVNHVGSGFPEDSIAFHEGQIQVILGHNGAGKTTLINMLTGMLQPDTGDCRVWGKSVLRDMDAIRGDLGLCPQHNILWPLLSCREHLLFFGGLKGTPRDKLAVLADQMLDLINLGSKKDAPASSLSGGQKRKLSVAISLIGGPKLVFLDEPTAGMDVESRRAMWHLLRRPDILRNRCIVLTTHYMDEADLLGDSVMIMDRGAVHSMGSPFFLKQNLGVGYNLTLAMQQGGSPEAVERAICGVVPNARFLSTSGNELKFQVPTHLPLTDELIEGAFLGLSASDSPASAADEAAHLELPAAAKLSAVDALLASPESDRLELALFLQKNVETADHTKRALGSLLEDCRAQAVFPALFNKLDAEKQALRVESYGIGVTTLEEVFMKIALGGADGDQEKVTGNKGRVVGEGSRDFKLYSIAAPGASPVRGVRLQWMQLKALMLKRMHSGRRDLRTLFYQFGSPVLFVLAALMLARIEPPDQSKILLGVSQFDVPLSTPVSQPAAGSDLLGPCLDHLATCPFPPLLSMVNATTMGSIPLSAYLLSSYFSHEATQRPVA